MELLQTIIIIILIIIAIVLFVFLIADIEVPYPTVISPFKTGTTIRIRSLANNKYLRIANCNVNNPPSYNTCTLTQGWLGCSILPVLQVVADADVTDSGIEWFLSEYTGTAPTPAGNAVYVIYYGSQNSGQVMYFSSANLNPVIVVSNPSNPAQFNDAYGKAPGPFFSFKLQENNLLGTTGSGIYQILNGNPRSVPNSGGDIIMTCLGTKDLSLYTTCSTVPTCQPAQACPVIVTMQDRTSVINNFDPLTYSFVIETL